MQIAYFHSNAFIINLLTLIKNVEITIMVQNFLLAFSMCYILSAHNEV